MHRIRKTPVLAFVLCLLIGLLAPTTAQASSDYDGVVNLTQLLKVTDGSGTTIDVTDQWRSVLADDSLPYAGNRTAFRSAFDAALANGVGWSVSQVNLLYASPDEYAVRVFVQAQGYTSQGIFNSTCLGVAAFCMTNAISATIYYSGSGDLKIGVEYSTSVITRFVAWADTSPTVTQDLLFANIPITYPSGYEGSLIPTEQPPATNADLGDSFISGHGNGPYEAGTADQCKRSPQAFPRLLQITLDLGPTAFVACSGATTANVLYGGSGEGSWGAPPQTDALSEDVQNAVISVGGNDAGFSSYLLGCLVACGPGTSIYDAMLDGIGATAFKENLKTTYETILEEAPNADVYVVDYPYMSAEDATTCGPFDFSGARNVQEALNGVIQDAVSEVNDSRLHYVPTNYTGSPFTGRHLCTTESGGSYFDITDMHPTPQGHQAYAGVLEEVVS